MKWLTGEHLVELFRLWRGDTINKIALYTVLAGIGAVTGWGQQAVSAVLKHIFGPDAAIADSPIWVGFTLIAMGIGLAVWNKLQGKAASADRAHPNDIKLLAKFRQLTPDHLQEFMRDHDFGNSFRRKILEPIDVLAYEWKGARYEFVDQDVQKRLQDVRSAIIEFLKISEERIFAHHMNVEMATTLTEMDRARGASRATLDAIKLLNQRASAVYESMQEFERAAVQRIDGRVA